MQVTKLKSTNGLRTSFRVYDDYGLPFEDINCFLRYQEKRDYSPNTVKASAAALEKMLAQSEEVNIARLSEKTGVSRSTIYRNKELRDLIDKFRETSLLRRNREVKFQKELSAERAAQSKLKTVPNALKAELLESTRLREENKRLKEHIEYLMDKYSKIHPI